MPAICAYYAGIMLNAFATYYAHNNYAGILGLSLLVYIISNNSKWKLYCQRPQPFNMLFLTELLHFSQARD